MKINKQTFFHVSDSLTWQVGQEYFIGKEYTDRYRGLMSRGFAVQNDQKEMIPMNAIMEATAQYIDTQQKAPFVPSNYHYNSSNALKESIPMMRSQLNLIRELIFEEVRQEFFPTKLSRYKALQVIPSKKESLGFWLPLLKTPNAKIYKLELTGEVHQGSLKLLESISAPADFYRLNAYNYWLGSEDNTANDDEYLFVGLANVVEVIDANKTK